ncbi:MAG: alpha-L-fucosidase [Capsulimonadales bacterium]|nr:alpha-L-fucosidase [Capsulimonadales bacterium]
MGLTTGFDPMAGMPEEGSDLEWFLDAKLGIFIHWGIYSVNGVSESWSFFNGHIPYDEYMAQLSGFTAEKFDPYAWAELFERAGARYVVLTAKHHDGVALFETALSDLSVVRKTPAARDLVAEFCAASRWKNLKVGLYFSHLDWSHPDYSPVSPGCTAAAMEDGKVFFRWTEGPYHPSWRNFIEFHRGQIRELCHNYAPDLLWFDGDWTPGPNWWDFETLRDDIDLWCPGVVVNSRIGKSGDYATPEQGVPIVSPRGPWEFCVTMNDSWGYQGKDRNYKSLRQIVRLFAECIGMGGNVLLGIGPMADGTIPAEQIERLEGLGQWMKRHAEAIYGTRAGLPHGHFNGPTTLNPSGDVLYLFFFDRPAEQRNSLSVKGIRNAVRSVSVVGSRQSLGFRTIGGASWAGIPGVLWIDLPPSALDRNATVLRVELEGPLDLFRGEGGAVTTN